MSNENSVLHNTVVALSQEVDVQEVTGVPSLSSSGMLVEFTLSVWEGRKKDKRASKQVSSAHGADAGVADVHKHLLGHCTQLEDLKRCRNAARTSHRLLTLPWSDMGGRLIATEAYLDYVTVMDAHRQQFEQLVREFLDVYDWEVIQAETRLGDMFNPMEYESRASLEHKFAFNLHYSPLPDAGDFRVDVQNEALEVLKTGYQDMYEMKIKQAMQDILFGQDRLEDTLTTLHRQLDWTEGEKRKKIYETVFDRVLETLDLMKTYNLTGNAEMEAVRVKLENEFRGAGRMPLSPEALKEDARMRSSTKGVLEDVLNTLPTIDL